MAMDARYAISIVLNARLPFVRKFTAPVRRLPMQELMPGDKAEHTPGGPDQFLESAEESWFFEALSETYLPLLDMFRRLEDSHVPFRLGFSLSPVFAQMLSDELLHKKYIAYLDNQIEFGKQELERVKSNPEMHLLAKRCFDQVVEQRASFASRYEGNIVRAFDYYQHKGNIEFLATTAIPAFLPFLCPYPESVQAQIEVALAYYRYSLGITPQGFWLPELGWVRELGPILRSYGFTYTITDSHGFVFGSPPPSRGTFYPAKTPKGLFILGRDFHATADIAAMQKKGPYRDNSRDIGYELPLAALGSFLSRDGARFSTGFKYWKAHGGNQGELYNPDAAQEAAAEDARVFLENCCSRLSSAARHMQEQPLSLCALNADSFGRQWHEGPNFLEALFRRAADRRELKLMVPSDYLCHQQASSFEISTPEFSSWGKNGYAEVWLDSSNDWIYRHLNRSIERMVELADRYSENSSLKERALNQAAREILLAQSSDWPAFLYRQEYTDYARFQLENALQNFTTIYEALGSSHISAEWLTKLERRHNIFPDINYRVFRRKR